MTPTPPPDARLTLLFEKFSAFVEDYASNLSMGGMFLETTERRPVGSIVDFEVKLSDGFRLVRGLGEVVWVVPAGSRSPAGLAVRFQSLDERGRELILKIMEEQVKSGGRPFDLEAVPAEALTAEGGSPAVEAAPGGERAPPPDASAGERKILGEDGFTLLDAEGAAPGPGGAQPQRAFEELEFDAPWGEELPEIPREVLEEDLESEVVLPRPSAPAVAAEDDVFAFDEEVAPAAPPDFVEDAAQDGIGDALLEDSYLLAEEAVAELDLTSTGAGELDFDDIDFSVAPGADEPGPGAPAAGDAAGSEGAGELEGEARPASEAPPAAEDLPDLPPFEAGFADDDDPTLMTSGARAAPLAAEPPAAASAATEDPEPAPAADAEADVFELVPETPAPVAPAVPAASAPGPPSMAVTGAAPAAAQEGDDDLFLDPPGAGAGRLLRQTLAGSGRSIAFAGLVLALIGTAYVYRHTLGEWLVPAGADAGPRAAPGPVVVARPAPPAVEPPPDVAETPPGEAAAGAPPAVADDVLSPPVIDVAVEEDEAAVPQSEPAPVPEEPAAAPGPSAVPPPRAISPPPAPASAAGTEAPATRVDRIAARRAEGGTLVTVELDGALAEGRWVHSGLSWAPDREMVEIKGVAEPYLSGRIAVGSAEIEQIRIGYHLRPGGNVLRIVLDFPGAGPRVAEVRGGGDRLEILVRR